MLNWYIISTQDIDIQQIPNQQLKCLYDIVKFNEISTIYFCV